MARTSTIDYDDAMNNWIHASITIFLTKYEYRLLDKSIIYQTEFQIHMLYKKKKEKMRFETNNTIFIPFMTYFSHNISQIEQPYSTCKWLKRT